MRVFPYWSLCDSVTVRYVDGGKLMCVNVSQVVGMSGYTSPYVAFDGIGSIR